MDHTLFSIPKSFFGKVASGAVKRAGANLHDAASGQIVGHLQEAGDLASRMPVPKGLNPFTVVTEVVNTGSQLVENVQNEQIKDLLEGLQMMTGATLALSAINLGVSSVGFAMMSKKLDALKGDLKRLEKGVAKIEDLSVQIDLKMMAKDRAAVVSLLRRGEEAWSDNDGGTANWREISRRLHEVEHYYRALLGMDGVHDRSIFLHASIPLREAMAAHEAMARLVAARIKTLVVLDELPSAKAYAIEFRDWLRERFRDFTPSSIVDARYRETAEREKKTIDLARLDLLPSSQAFVKLVREQQLFADSIVELLETLIRRGDVSGRTYVRQLQEETEHPFLILERPQ